jgi:hypothetical protein
MRTNDPRKGKDRLHHVSVVESAACLKITGKYMAVLLEKLYVGIPLRSTSTGKIREFVIIGCVFENLWDYPLHTLCSDYGKMIDSDGFQHDRSEASEYEYTEIRLPGERKYTKMSFSGPEFELRGRAKTRGFVWFDSLPKGVHPQRLIFEIPYFLRAIWVAL